MKTKHLFVSAISIISIIACGGMKVDLAPDAKADEPTACECSGEVGAEGPQGPEGVEGPAGPEGARGSKGEKGDRGVTGNVGPQGSVGPAGAQGPVGPQGPQGEPGVEGPAGPTMDASLVYVRTADVTVQLGQGSVRMNIEAFCDDGDLLISSSCGVVSNSGIIHAQGGFQNLESINCVAQRETINTAGSMQARAICLAQ